MICDSTSLKAFLDSCPLSDGKKICAVDTEADSLHRYKESLCLVQFTAGDQCVLIDPLAIKDLTPLSEYLRDAIVWMHGADYDMTMLKREFGHIPPVVYDTQIGARLLGLRAFGLGNLVEHFFQISLSKTSQKADWGKRPLSETMVEYALNDVRYLLEMGTIIVSQLIEKERYEWFVESCQSAREKVAERDESREEQWRISGSGKFEAKDLAALRALWNWRDKEAETWDKPSFMVAPNRLIVEWATLMATGKKIELPNHFRGDRIKRFREMHANFLELTPDQYPTRIVLKRRKRDSSFDARVDSLIALRNRLGTELDIDGSLIASRTAIEAIAANESEPAEILMSWQRELLDL